MSNLELWQKVEKTDPKHVKAITGKSYQGSSPKPHYLIHKATETFGPVGIGWGFSIVDERIEEGAGGEKMHIARVKVWFKWNGERGEVEHIGGTQFSGTRKSGQPFTDEDAPKKSVTDAIVKALSMIGFAGDIFMGRYDDSKYVSEVKEEFSEPRQDQSPSSDRFSKADSRKTYADIQNAIDSAKTLDELKETWISLQPVIKTLPKDWESEITSRKDQCKRNLEKNRGLAQITAPNFDNLQSGDPLDEILQSQGKQE